MKRVTIASLLCALVFGLLATWLGPKMIAYWYAPPVPAGAASAFNCTDAVQWAMSKLVLTQLDRLSHRVRGRDHRGHPDAPPGGAPPGGSASDESRVIRRPG